MAVWVISGVAGSGKSSLGKRLSERLGCLFLDADDFHPPANKQKMQAGQALTEADREPWLQALGQALAALGSAEAVLAFPGLRAAHRQRLRQAQPGLRFAWLDADLELVQERLAQRGGFFPASLAESQFAAVESDEGAFLLNAGLSLDTLTEQALAWARPGQAMVVGLGRMGLGLARRLHAAGFEVLAWDKDAAACARAREEGLRVVQGLGQLPRRILLSLPAGAATQEALDQLGPHLKAGDLLIDAANARHQDSQARAGAFAAKGVDWVDAGVSGGIPGAKLGFGVMAGGSDAAYAKAYPILHALAKPGALVHCGPAGTGHLVKTVHNGIEYGLMQAYGEGFELLRAAGGGQLPLAEIARSWNEGAVVRSWLLELAAEALKQDGALSRFEGRVGENSTGRWAADLAQEQGVPVPALEAALLGRERSREQPSYGSQLLSALRASFGGHKEAQG